MELPSFKQKSRERPSRLCVLIVLILLSKSETPSLNSQFSIFYFYSNIRRHLLLYYSISTEVFWILDKKNKFLRPINQKFCGKWLGFSHYSMGHQGFQQTLKLKMLPMESMELALPPLLLVIFFSLALLLLNRHCYW